MRWARGSLDRAMACRIALDQATGAVSRRTPNGWLLGPGKEAPTLVLDKALRECRCFRGTVGPRPYLSSGYFRLVIAN